MQQPAEEEAVEPEQEGGVGVRQQPISRFPLRLASVLVVGALVLFGNLLVAHSVCPAGFRRLLPAGLYNTVFCLQAILAKRTTPVVRAWQRRQCLEAFSLVPRGAHLPPDRPVLGRAAQRAADGTAVLHGAAGECGGSVAAAARECPGGERPHAPCTFLRHHDSLASVFGPAPQLQELLPAPAPLVAEGLFVWLPSQKLLFQTVRGGGPGPHGRDMWVLDLGNSSASPALERLDSPCTGLGGASWAPTQVLLSCLAQGAGEPGPVLLVLDVATRASHTLLGSGRRPTHVGGVAVDSGTSFWFTTPHRPESGSMRLGGAVWHSEAPSGSTRLAASGFTAPAGLALAQAGNTLYVSELPGPEHDMSVVWAYDVREKGQLLNKRAFAALGDTVSSGIQVDARGNVYVGTSQGVSVYSQGGILLGKICAGHVGQLAIAQDLLLLLQRDRIGVVRLAQ